MKFSKKNKYLKIVILKNGRYLIAYPVILSNRSKRLGRGGDKYAEQEKVGCVCGSPTRITVPAPSIIHDLMRTNWGKKPVFSESIKHKQKETRSVSNGVPRLQTVPRS